MLNIILAGPKFQVDIADDTGYGPSSYRYADIWTEKTAGNYAVSE